MNKAKTIIISMTVITYAVLLIIFSQDVAASVSGSVMNCLTSLIPSLFAFMVIADFICSTNIYILLSKPFDIVSRYVFRIPAELFPVYLISQFAGYPVGARLIGTMYKQGKIDKSDAEAMLGNCFLAGPAFICGVAGINLFGSIAAGMVIFISILISNFIAGAVLALKRPVPEKKTAGNNAHLIKIGISDLTSSVTSGAKGMFSVCVMVVFFSSFICLLDCLGIIPYLSSLISNITGFSHTDCTAFIKGLIEISNIKDFTSGNILLLPIITSLLSFGGLCVIMQVESFAGADLSTKNFYLGRIMSIFISYSCSKIITGTLVQYDIISVMKPVNAAVRQISPIPSIFLLIMTILLLSKNYIVNIKDI